MPKDPEPFFVRSGATTNPVRVGVHRGNQVTYGSGGFQRSDALTRTLTQAQRQEVNENRRST